MKRLAIIPLILLLFACKKAVQSDDATTTNNHSSNSAPDYFSAKVNGQDWVAKSDCNCENLLMLPDFRAGYFPDSELLYLRGNRTSADGSINQYIAFSVNKITGPGRYNMFCENPCGNFVFFNEATYGTGRAYSIYPNRNNGVVEVTYFDPKARVIEGTVQVDGYNNDYSYLGDGSEWIHIADGKFRLHWTSGYWWE